jgi:ABC-type sugar transport system ATPase subunit
MAEVIIKKLSKFFGEHAVISDLDLDINDGEFVTLLGPSGCGKSTLLRIIAGLETADKGDLIINNTRYNNIPSQYRKVAMVFQSYALFPHMTVYSNIRFGLMISKVDDKRAREKISWALSLLRLNGLENRLPREISGGQRQRVALARALVLDPEVLLLDEPLSNLDTALREKAMEELKRIHRHVGTTIIYVSHNQTEAMTLSQRIAVLNSGRLEQYDTPSKVYDFPRTIFAAEFIGSPSMNLFDGTIVHKDDMTGINSNAGFIKLDKNIESKLNGIFIKDVKIGIRPQNIALAGSYDARRSSDTTLQIVVDLVQSLGDRSFVVGRTQDGSVLRFLISAEDDIKPDQSVSIVIDGRRIHIFNKQDMNIFSN